MTNPKLNFPEFEVQGRWFLPERPDNDIVGILKFSSNQGTELKLIGSLFETNEETIEEHFQKAFGEKDIPIILGILLNGETIGEKVTLYQNKVYGEGTGTGLTQTKCISTYILRGFHFYKEEEIRFDNVYFHFANLEKWLRIKSINVTMTPDADQTRIEELCVQYNPLPWQLLCDMGDFNLGIRDQPLNPTQLYFASVFSYHFDQINVSENKVFELNSPSNSQQVVIFTISLLIEKKLFKVLLLFLQNIHSLTQNCLESYIESIFKIQDFLVFATGQSINLTEVGTFFQITVKKPKMERNINHPVANINSDEKNIIFKNEYFSISKSDEPRPQFIEEEVEETVPIKIYFAPSTSNSEEKFDENKVLFYFADIQNNIADVFLKWCKDSQIKSIINLYLGLFYIPKRYLTERFLNLAQAIEAFHRIVYRGRYIDEMQYKNGIYTSLLNTIDKQSNQYKLSSEFKDSLKQRLSYLYEFSLRKRLKELIKSHQACFPVKFLANKKLRDNFISAVVLVRNKLTHLDENTEIESIIEYRELYKLSNYMEALLRCCIMKFLEIDEEVIKRSIERILRH